MPVLGTCWVKSFNWVYHVCIVLPAWSCAKCRKDTITADYSYIPSVVFSSPHVAKVGLDEEDAVERYSDVNIYSTTFR